MGVVLLVRHGQASFGAADYDNLSPTGHEQSRVLGAALAARGISADVVVAGEMKRYRYPRWQFTNVSEDIKQMCCWALDLVGVAWRTSNHKTISVSRREAVAALDELIGFKS